MKTFDEIFAELGESELRCKICLEQKYKFLALQLVWPDWVKFRHFGQILNVFGNIWEFIEHWAKFWTKLGKFRVFYWANSNVTNGQILYT